MDRFERAFYALARTLARAGMLLLLAFAASTLFDGALRWLFGRPLDIVRDCGGVVVAVAVSSCFPLLVLERGNIVITFIEGMLGRFGNRLLNTFAAFCTSAVCFALAWQFLVHANNLRRGTETTPLLSIPTAPFWYLVDVNFWLCAIAQCVVLIQTARARSSLTVEREMALH
jgi:TRAP-type C4-dicarboxylate transport system permease small subunit